MNTINAIPRLLREYTLRLERITATDENSYEAQVATAQQALKEKFNKLRQIYPELIQVNYDSAVTPKEGQAIIENLRRRMENKYVAENIATGEVLRDVVNGEEIFTPNLVRWQHPQEQKSNFVISYNKFTQSKAIQTMNALVSNIMLSLPIKQVHLNFVDLNFTGGGQLFTQNLDKSLFRDLIVDAQQLSEFCKELQQRLASIVQDCGDLAKYNREKKMFRYPYEVVVLLDYPNFYGYSTEQLIPLFQNGHKGGIYFVVMNNTEVKPEESVKKVLTDMKECYREINLKNVDATTSGIINVTPVLSSRSMSETVFRYINEEATRKPKAIVLKANYQGMYDTPYTSTNSLIEVPVGGTPSGQEVLFRMATKDFVHCFILGKSGSGKSVFLHNIIAWSMLKYTPEDLQFYLLDFKLGGVEFNRYKNAKHVKALLVDNSDLSITLEILRDINEAMQERGKRLRAAGVSNIDDYNRANPNEHMPQILFVADECHAMFDEGNNDNRKLMEEMQEVLKRIAKEGRSQGVHLIMATQTLAGANIPNDILNNISDHYLLNCAEADSDKLVPGSSSETAKLTTGQVFYHNVKEGTTTFQGYYTRDEEVDTVTGLIEKKAQQHQSNGQFYFSGSQIFNIDDEVIGSLPAKRNPVAALGCSISLKHDGVNIQLKEDDGENILFQGINDEEQTTTVVMDALYSLIETNKRLGRDLKVKVLDFLGFDEPRYTDLTDRLEHDKLIEIIGKRDAGQTLFDLADSIANEKARETLLVVLGQERFRQLKLDQKLEVASASQESAPADNGGGFDSMDFGSGLDNFDFGGSDSSSEHSNDSSRYDTYRKALRFILENGPRVGVNTILQIDHVKNLLYSELMPNEILTLFNHFVLLRCDYSAASKIGLENVKTEILPKDLERLRAYYYAADRDEVKYFAPYMEIK